MERLEQPPQRAVRIWLYVCAAVGYAVLVVGGITRLTHSGLSIAEVLAAAHALIVQPPVHASAASPRFVTSASLIQTTCS